MKNLLLTGRILSIALYLTTIIVWIASGAWWWFVILLLLHFIDAAVFGIREGSRYNKNIGFSLIATMLFGFCWWLALKKGLND